MNLLSKNNKGLLLLKKPNLKPSWFTKKVLYLKAKQSPSKFTLGLTHAWDSHPGMIEYY
jgi:hypothetical protein